MERADPTVTETFCHRDEAERWEALRGILNSYLRERLREREV